MGYCGLEHWGASDNAADSHWIINKTLRTVKDFNKVNKKIEKVVLKELREAGNDFNTSGPINIGLLIEDNQIPIACLSNKTKQKILDEVNDEILTIQDDRESFVGNMKNFNFHLNAYKRILKSIKKKFKLKNKFIFVDDEEDYGN